MNTLRYRAMVLFFLLSPIWVPVQAEEGVSRMPPAFNLDADPEQVLTQYPLGEVTKVAAFAHHGKAHRELKLPNGRFGWLYDVGRKEWHRTYTLVFGKDETVIDVMYFDHSKYSGRGLTAMQLQSASLLQTKTPSLGGGPRQ